jgi:hypothetical protein
LAAHRTRNERLLFGMQMLHTLSMAATERITVTLPQGLLREVDARDENRSRFVAEAVHNELARRKHVEFLASLEQRAWTHEDDELIEADTNEWFAQTTPADSQLVDPTEGTPVYWQAGVGWLEGDAALEARKPASQSGKRRGRVRG